MKKKTWSERQKDDVRVLIAEAKIKNNFEQDSNSAGINGKGGQLCQKDIVNLKPRITGFVEAYERPDGRKGS